METEKRDIERDEVRLKQENISNVSDIRIMIIKTFYEVAMVFWMQARDYWGRDSCQGGLLFKSVARMLLMVGTRAA